MGEALNLNSPNPVEITWNRAETRMIVKMCNVSPPIMITEMITIIIKITMFSKTRLNPHGSNIDRTMILSLV